MKKSIPPSAVQSSDCASHVGILGCACKKLTQAFNQGIHNIRSGRRRPTYGGTVVHHACGATGDCREAALLRHQNQHPKSAIQSRDK